MAIWASMEKIQVTLDATLEPVTTNLSKSQDETQCVPWITSRAAGTLTDQHQDRMIHVEMIDNAGTPAVRCTAGARADNDDSIIEIFVVEFDSSIRVQQRSLNVTGTSAAISDLTSVGAIDDAFAIYSCEFTSPPTSDDDFNDSSARVVMTDTTTVTVSRNASGGTLTGTIYVVDCDSNEWFVHHHSESFSSETTTIRVATIDGSPTVVLVDCFTLHSYETDEATDDMKDAMWSAHLDSTTQLEFERNQGSASNSQSSTHTVQIVECANNEWDVQRNTAFATSGANVKTDISITAVDRTRSVAHHCSGCAGDAFRAATNNSSAGNSNDDEMQSCILSADDNLQFERNSTAFGASRIYWEVIQFEALGTLFFQTNTGGLTPSGAFVKETQKTLAGSFAPSGAMTKETSKLLAGALTPSGGLVKETLKALAGSLMPSGVLVAATTFAQSLAGALTPVGDIVKETQKALAGSLTPAGTLVRDVSKTIAGALTPTGTLAKKTLKNLAGSLTPTGALGSIVIFTKAVAGALTPSGVITKQTQKSLAGAVTPAGALVKETAKPLAGALTPSGAITKETQKSLAGSLTPSGVLGTIVIFLQAVAGALTPTSTMTKETQKNVAGTLTPGGNIVKLTTKSMSGSVTPTGALTTAATFLRTVVGALAPSGVLGTLFIAGGGGPVGRLYRRTLTLIYALQRRR